MGSLQAHETMGFEVIDTAKAALEVACPRVVSCTDILAFAARDSATLAGNITWKVPAGHHDGNVSIDTDAMNDLPPPSSTTSELIDKSAQKNLIADEMVTLSGAHIIYCAHCFTFTSQLYNPNDNSLQTDPTLNTTYADLLRGRFPASSGPFDTATMFLDIITPNVLDNRYYAGIQNNLGLFSSDQALVINATLLTSIKNNAKNPNGWANKFMRAMIQIGTISVLEGTNGQIRTNCRVVNRTSTTSQSSWKVETELDRVVPEDNGRATR